MGKITLKAARVNADMTQAEAAEELGVAVSTIKNWEKGTTFPKQPHILAMCQLYGVSYDAINFLPK